MEEPVNLNIECARKKKEQSWTKYMRQTLVLLEAAHYSKRSVSVFQQGFASIHKIFIFQGQLSTSL